jgi:hypothetical protein
MLVYVLYRRSKDYVKKEKTKMKKLQQLKKLLESDVLIDENAERNRKASLESQINELEKSIKENREFGLKYNKKEN